MSFLAPVFGAIASAWSAGGVAGLFLRLGASLILSSLSSRLAAKQATPNANWGARGITITDPLATRKIVYGNVRIGGVKRFQNVSDKDIEVPGGVGGLLEGIDTDDMDQRSAIMDLVIVFAGHEVAEIGNIYFDGKLAVRAGERMGTGRYAGAVWAERANGSVDQTAFPRLNAALPGKWSLAHRMRGCAGIHLTLYYDPEEGQNIFPTGEPNVTADIKGKCDILDPRTGLRGWTDNAALCTADYMSLPASLSIAAQIGADDGIIQADLIESANICDELVTRAAGGTEPRYTCNGVIDTANTVQANIQALLSSMAGECIPIGGAFSIRAAAYRAPVTTFTLDEAVGDPVLTTLVEISENFNGVRGKFFSPSNDWQPDDFPPIQSAVYLAEDRGQDRWKDLSLEFTTSASMAQRIAKIELERQRRQMRVEWSGMLSCWRAAADDTIALTVPYWGFDAKPFEVRQVSLTMSADDDGATPTLLPSFVLRETSPLITSWTATEEQIYAAAPATTLPDPFDVLPPGVPVVTEELYETRDGGGVKARMVISWAGSPSVAVTSYELRLQQAGGAWEYPGPTTSTSAIRADAAPGLWTVQVRATTALGVRTAWEDASAVVEVRGLSAPPAALTGTSLQSAGGLAVLKWALPADLDVRSGGHIVVRHSSSPVPVWEGSIAMDEVAGAQTLAVVNLLPGSYLLRPRDSTGQFGPMTVLATDGITATPFVPIGMLQEDDEFSGTHFGTYVAAGLLNIGSNGDLWASADLYAEPNLYTIGGNILTSASYEFAAKLDLGAVKAVRLRRDVQMLSVSINSDLYAEADLWGMADLYQSKPGAADVVIEISTTPDDPASGVAVWSGWRRLDATDISARGVKARAVLSTQNPLITPVLSRLRIIAEETA